MQLQSSNPTLARDDAFQQFYGQSMAAEKSNVTTLQGVVNKTAILVFMAVAAGACGYAVFLKFPPVLWIGAITSFVVCLGFGFLLARKPAASPVVAPIYAIVEGLFLGAFTAVADNILASKGLTAFGGVGVQAFIVTMAVMVSMLILYKARIIQPTRRLQAVVGVATGGIMLAYLASFILSFFGYPLPFISFASAVNDVGMMGFIGLGINLVILGIAALMLVIDFGLVEQKVAIGAPKYMEWYCGFALLVTLAWIYFEAVKLIVRLAILFGDRR